MRIRDFLCPRFRSLNRAYRLLLRGKPRRLLRKPLSMIGDKVDPRVPKLAARISLISWQKLMRSFLTGNSLGSRPRKTSCSLLA
jgi:hypothetical protein